METGHVKQSELEEKSTAELPFSLLAGENLMHSGTSVDGSVLITNYRLNIQNGRNHYHIPLGSIEVVEPKELFYLNIGCKDARTYRCTFENNEVCLEWCNRIAKAAETPEQLNQLFAFYHCISTQQTDSALATKKLESQRQYTFDKEMFENEMERLQFAGDSWRISKANEQFTLCPSYPPYLLVPSCINDAELESVSKFRSSKRIPAAVWRHTRNGAVIARCSQPEVGWLGWRSADDEELLKAISAACNFDNSERNNDRGSDRESNLSHSPGSYHSNESLQITGEIKRQDKKVLVMDARSYTTAVANRARGGGCECPEYYPNCEMQFMNLANIHSIRKSFHALRQLCTSSADQPNWYSQLEGTRWLLHMSGLMKAAVTLVTAVERDERPVLVHCSDGWDRTPQIVSLAELLLDPYYRTLDGFRILIEREWLAFGHKFADRCGNSGSDDQNERCPVFLQWLDCVHQVLSQFPCSFEFSQTYLVKLAQHTYSNLYGTFLCNTQRERLQLLDDNTFSVWDFLKSPCFRNHLYASGSTSLCRKVLWPQSNVRDLKLWSAVYVGSMEANFSSEDGTGFYPGPPESSPRHMTKTRSYGDLQSAGDNYPNHFRRCSDPSINSDSNPAVLAPEIPQENIASAQGHIQNGHDNLAHLRQPDFYPSDLEDADYKQDFLMFKNNTDNLTDDQIDGLDQADFDKPSTSTSRNVVKGPQVYENGEGTSSNVNENVINCETERIKSDLDILKSVCLSDGGEKTVHKGDLNLIEIDNSRRSNENGVAECEVGNSSKEGSVLAGSSRDVGAFFDVERSVETSTETLVSENIICSSSPKEINGFEKIQSPVGNSEMTDGCAQNIRFNQEAHSSHHYGRDHRTRYSSSPFYSNSSTGWDNTLHNLSQQKHVSYQYTLGDDGLIPLRCVVQERLDQIIDEQQRKVDLLEKELHVTRQNLIKQSCHRCKQIDSERQDDNSSVVESVFSASEGQASTGESLRSELSWVAVEEASLADCQTLWVPDHAVNRCTGCGTEFWLGRRRHHCRKCGKIFCADCSENSTPLPSEQLYNPVRVCTGCYSELRRDCGEIPNQCKHANTQTTNTNPQIAASSN